MSRSRPILVATDVDGTLIGSDDLVPAANLAVVEDLVADWDRPYSREQGCFPPGAFRIDKYWPPVGRVDNAYGDRHLVCSCPPWEPATE